MSAHPHPSPGAASAALSRLLDATASALQAIRAGQSGTAALAATDAALRPAVQALLFQVLRNLGRAQALRRLLAPRKPPPRVDALLCTALALAWEPESAPYEPFTLVNQAVEAAKRSPARHGSAAFINACLRRFLREREGLVAATQGDETAVWNHPAWWIQRLRRDHPQCWQQILQANNAPAPMVLRVARQKSTSALYQKALAAINIESTAVGGWGVVLARPVPVQRLPGFDEGVVSVQDAAAQMAAPLLLDGLDAGKSLRLLDACAAPGGKTAHLLELADIELLALDADAGRLARVQQNLDRLGLAGSHVRLKAADAADLDSWWDGKPFDAVLADVPCTASGIVRRHPDIRWLRRENDVRRTATLQARILDALWRTVAPGGRLLYVTCSVFPLEGTRQALEFMQRHADAVRLDAPGQLLPVAVDATPAAQHDGFFYALFAKQT